MVGVPRNSRLLVALVAGLASLLLACADEDLAAVPAAVPESNSGAPIAFPVTIKDSAGTDVRLERMPDRIVSLSPGATEILYAIGAGGRVVGTDQFSDYPAATATTTKLDYSGPNPEAALALRPDLVIMATRQQAQVEQFRRLGMTVFFAREPEDLEAFVALRPSDPQGRRALALAWLRLGRVDAAAAEYSIASDLAPGDASIALRLARALESLGKLREARAAFARADEAARRGALLGSSELAEVREALVRLAP